MTVKLSTGEWTIYTKPFAGLTCTERVIVVNAEDAVSGKDLLDTFIHETLHASDHRLGEAEVSRLAGDITEVLWKAGYRLKKRQPKRRTAAHKV